MKKPQEHIKLDVKTKEASGFFNLVEFADNTFRVSYLPSLNLTAYGSTKNEAREMLTEVVKDYFNNLLELPEYEIFKELQQLGWERNKLFSKELSKEVHIDRAGILKNFNLSAETVLEASIIEA